MVLELLDGVEDLGDVSGSPVEVDAQLLGLHRERRAPGELAHDDAREVAHRDRVDVLVGLGQARGRARVHAALVRERARAHVGLVRVGREVRGLGDEVADLGEQLELVARDAVVAHLEHERRDDADEVGVAGALAVAVHGALHVRAAGLDGDERVRDRAAGVVVRVDAERHVERERHLAHDAQHLVRQRAAVGVAQHDRVGARLGRRAGRPRARTSALAL